MQTTCADCGCLVDLGVIMQPCEEHPECCCRDLPISTCGRLMGCACCGRERDVVALRSREDVAICRECLDWVRAKSGVVDVTPIVPVRDLDRSTSFYTDAGFDVRRYEGGGFAFVSYEDESVFDLDPADGFDVEANRAGCALIVPDADAWHRRLSAAGLAVTEIADQPWGLREFTLTDPDGELGACRRHETVPTGAG